jgi:short subunit fatty acids transporter
MEVALTQPRRPSRRLVYGALALALLAFVVVEVVKHGTGFWQLAAFGVGPDLALLLGTGAGLARGQLHPRAVPAYNALHRFWGPLALLLVAVAVLPLGYFVGALAWAFHIALDRTVGYGQRTSDGFQRS